MPRNLRSAKTKSKIPVSNTGSPYKSKSPRVPGTVTSNVPSSHDIDTAQHVKDPPVINLDCDEVDSEVRPRNLRKRDHGESTKPSKGVSQLLKIQAAAKREYLQKDSNRYARTLLSDKASWVHRNFPKNLDELFVHKKKVEEFQSWVKDALNVNRRNSAGKICVLTGPPGCGKTATVALCAKEMNIEVKEWINPMTLNEFNKDPLGTKDRDSNFYFSDNQFELFSNFLFRASQYSTLPIQGRTRYENKLVLVEDLPNIFYRNPALFHDSILRPYQKIGLHPVVFVMSDCPSQDINTYQIFSKAILSELRVPNIIFNAVASTFMNKFLLKLCSKEGVSIDKSLLENVVTCSNGDIRCAINTLQFKLSQHSGGFCSDGFKVPPKKPAKTKTDKSKSSDLNENVRKDETLFLFRALGKVLYSKREDPKPMTCKICAGLGQQECRYVRSSPLQENPEELISKMEVSSEMFLDFLQQNYVHFFTKLDDLSSAASFLADASFTLSNWSFDTTGTLSRSYKERESKDEICALVASRGVMFSNTQKASNSWRPLRKPAFIDVKNRMTSSIREAYEIFTAGSAIHLSFFTEDIPLYCKLMRYSSNPWNFEQQKYITQTGKFTKGRLQRNMETLQEKDPPPVQEDDAVSASCSANSEDVNSSVIVDNAEHTDDEEFVIEDYDDM